MAAVDVESLTVTYGKVTAVDDLTFHADAGEVTCLLGPNGAGKTSTVEALEGLRRPTSGRLSVIGLDPRVDHRTLTERIGVMLQEGGIHPAMRVGEALRHAAALYPNPIDPRGLIDRLGLTGLERRPHRRLSGGEQRRLALALALVGRPQVAFLDEPTAGVDPAGRQVIRQVIADLRSDGVTVLLTTHDLDEAERVADRVVIVVGGRLVAEGSIEDLTRSSGTDEQVRFRAPPGLDRASLAHHLGGVAVAETAPGDYAVATSPTPQAVAAITAWLADHDLPLADLRAGRQRLEDVYLRLTADGAAAASPRRRRGPSRRDGVADGEPSGDRPGRQPGERPGQPPGARSVERPGEQPVRDDTSGWHDTPDGHDTPDSQDTSGWQDTPDSQDTSGWHDTPTGHDTPSGQDTSGGHDTPDGRETSSGPDEEEEEEDGASPPALRADEIIPLARYLDRTRDALDDRRTGAHRDDEDRPDSDRERGW